MKFLRFSDSEKENPTQGIFMVVRTGPSSEPGGDLEAESIKTETTEALGDLKTEIEALLAMTSEEATDEASEMEFGVETATKALDLAARFGIDARGALEWYRDTPENLENQIKPISERAILQFIKLYPYEAFDLFTDKNGESFMIDFFDKSFLEQNVELSDLLTTKPHYIRFGYSRDLCVLTPTGYYFVEPEGQVGNKVKIGTRSTFEIHNADLTPEQDKLLLDAQAKHPHMIDPEDPAFDTMHSNYQRNRYLVDHWKTVSNQMQTALSALPEMQGREDFVIGQFETFRNDLDGLNDDAHLHDPTEFLTLVRDLTQTKITNFRANMANAQLTYGTIMKVDETLKTTFIEFMQSYDLESVYQDNAEKITTLLGSKELAEAVLNDFDDNPDVWKDPASVQTRLAQILTQASVISGKALRPTPAQIRTKAEDLFGLLNIRTNINLDQTAFSYFDKTAQNLHATEVIGQLADEVLFIQILDNLGFDKTQLDDLSPQAKKEALVSFTNTVSPSDWEAAVNAYYDPIISNAQAAGMSFAHNDFNAREEEQYRFHHARVLTEHAQMRASTGEKVPTLMFLGTPTMVEMIVEQRDAILGLKGMIGGYEELLKEEKALIDKHEEQVKVLRTFDTIQTQSPEERETFFATVENQFSDQWAEHIKTQLAVEDSDSQITAPDEADGLRGDAYEAMTAHYPDSSFLESTETGFIMGVGVPQQKIEVNIINGTMQSPKAKNIDPIEAQHLSFPAHPDYLKAVQVTDALLAGQPFSSAAGSAEDFEAMGSQGLLFKTAIENIYPATFEGPLGGDEIQGWTNLQLELNHRGQNLSDVFAALGCLNSNGTLNARLVAEKRTMIRQVVNEARVGLFDFLDPATV